MTEWRIIFRKLNAWAEPLENLLYEVRPLCFLVFGLAAIFLNERNLLVTLLGVMLIFVSGYALKARFDFRKRRPPK